MFRARLRPKAKGLRFVPGRETPQTPQISGQRLAGGGGKRGFSQELAGIVTRGKKKKEEEEAKKKKFGY